MSAQPFVARYRSQQCIEHYLPVAPAEYNEIYQFITFEALLLDHGRYGPWIKTLSAELQYRLVGRAADDVSLPPEASPVALVEYDYASICRRACQLESDAATGGAATVKLRRLISNLSVSSSMLRQYDIISYMLVSGSSSEQPGGVMCTIERHDRLCRTGRVLKLVNRELIVDSRAQDLAQLPLIV